MTSIRSSVRPKSSKQAWGTILEPEFGLGFQKMTGYEIDQTVTRLYKVPDQKKRIDEKKEQKEMNATEISDMVKRLQISSPLSTLIINSSIYSAKIG